MAVKKRCGFCRKVLRQDTLTCKNPDCPRYVPDPEPEPVKPTETPSEGTATPSEGDTSPAVETPSTGEPAQSATDTNDGGNTETEPTP